MDYSLMLEEIIINQLNIIDVLEIMDLHLIWIFGMMFFVLGWYELTRRY